MDELKLDKWKENFQKEKQNLQIEFDSFFQTKKLNQYYELKVDEVTQNLSLEITDATLPKDVQKRLIDLFNATKPEDSI
jgi:hypothetical protein